jgi:two-component sensor histidine kinase
MLAAATERSSFPIYLGPLRAEGELRYRLQQQSLLAEFGRAALQTRDVRKMLQLATELCARGVAAPFAEVLEFVPTQGRLVVRASHGRAANSIETLADGVSPGGLGYRTGQTAIRGEIGSDRHFEMPRRPTDPGANHAIDPPFERDGRGEAVFGGESFFGVLEVGSPDSGGFDQADADFLASFAGLLGIAIERQQADARLRDALDYQALLALEMSHRVKNSLASVIGLLRVQSRATAPDEVRTALDEAVSRVATIAEVHNQLCRGSQIGFIDLANFIRELCSRLQSEAGAITLNCQADAVLLAADHAIPLGLLVNELVTNAFKYAYPGGSGAIDVFVRNIENGVHLEVSDRGVGLPDGFDINQTRSSLGLKVITGLVRQLGGRLTIQSNQPTGARFLFNLPILAESGNHPGATGLQHEQQDWLASS